jgi:hypothetical protein
MDVADCASAASKWKAVLNLKALALSRYVTWKRARVPAVQTDVV